MCRKIQLPIGFNLKRMLITQITIMQHPFCTTYSTHMPKVQTPNWATNKSLLEVPPSACTASAPKISSPLGTKSP